MLYNAANTNEHNILLLRPGGPEHATYELYKFRKSSRDGDHRNTVDESPSPLRGLGDSAAFVSRNRFAVLDQNKLNISLKNLENETRKKLRCPAPNINHIFPAGIQRVLLRCPDRLILFDTGTGQTVNELATPGRFPVKYVVWADKHQNCAILSKYNLFITDKELNQLCLISETSRVKSGAWDPSGVFIYTTQNHIKYCLPNGESGIVRTLESPIYVTAVKGRTMFALDREWNPLQVDIDDTEYKFKLSLEAKNYREVARIIKSDKLVGEAIIAYLLKNDFAEGALQFKQDPKTKFSLAIECGNIEAALECAEELNTPECWQKLGTEALRQGLQQVVENALVKTENLEHLSFLYLITGNFPNMRKMLTISEHKDDPMSQFHNALFLGDVESRIKILKETGFPQLAYTTAVTHGLEDQVEDLKEQLEKNDIPIPDVSNASLLQPPMPILRNEGWPKLEVPKGVLTTQYFEDLDHQREDAKEREERGGDDLFFGGDDNDGGKSSARGGGDDFFGDDLDDESSKKKGGDDDGDDLFDDDMFGLGDDEPDKDDDLLGDEDEVGDDEDEDEDEDDEWGVSSSAADKAKRKKKRGGKKQLVWVPEAGRSPKDQWVRNSPTIADFAAAGAFDMAMESLHRQFGIVHFEPLKPMFMRVNSTSHVQVQMLPNTEPQPSPLMRSIAPSLPLIGYSFDHCFAKVQMAYDLVSERSSNEEALEIFTEVLHTLPLLLIDSQQRLKEVQDLTSICREYITALRLNAAREALGAEDSAVRKFELAVYYTMRNLQQVHTYMGLLVAIKQAREIQNFRTAAVLIKRLLEISFHAELTERQRKPLPGAQKFLKVCERKDSDAEELKFNIRETVQLCTATFQPIARNQEVACPFCLSKFEEGQRGKTCPTCNIAQIGKDARGFTVQQQPLGGGGGGASSARSGRGGGW